MQFASLIGEINWVDIFIVIILIRAGYVALKNGLASEFFKILGLVFCSYLALHYHSGIVDLVQNRLGFKKVSTGFLNFVFFVILAAAGYALFVLLRKIFSRFIKMEAIPTLNKWGGFFLGILRGLFLASLILFILVISEIQYFRKSIRSSASGRFVLRIAPVAYNSLWRDIVSKFFPSEKLNEQVNSAQEDLYKK